MYVRVQVLHDTVRCYLRQVNTIKTTVRLPKHVGERPISAHDDSGHFRVKEKYPRRRVLENQFELLKSDPPLTVEPREWPEVNSYGDDRGEIEFSIAPGSNPRDQPEISPTRIVVIKTDLNIDMMVSLEVANQLFAYDAPSHGTDTRRI